MSRLARIAALGAVVFAWHWSAGDASAAAVQQVQSGTAVNSANGIQTITISSVDPARSFLIFETRHDSNRPVGSLLRGRLASATTIEFARVTNGTAPEPAPINIQWYVVSFSSGVRVQRGEVAQSATTVNVSISAVAAVGQAFVLWSKTAAAGDSTWGSDDAVLGELTSTTNLQFRTDGANTAHTIAWQVVEFTNAADINVQTGSITTMTGTTTSVTATLSPTVNMSKTFVLAGWRTSGTGAIGSRMLRARLTSPTTVTIDRSTSGAPDDITEIVWQAVELRDNSVVVGGSSSFAAGVPSQTVQLIPPVAATRAVAFGSSQSGGGQNMGTSPYAGDDVIGVGSFTADLGIAFRSAASASAGSGALTLSVPRPAGTAEFDVMVASIGFRPNTAVITPPAGWTLVRRIDNANATANSLAVYWKMAEATEPASYAWTFNTSTGSAGGILSFVNVDTVNPIDVENGQNTPNGLAHAAPSVTTTRRDEMIVSAHGFSSSATWTPPAGLTEAVDIASETVPNCCGIAIAVNYGLQSAAGSTGALTATASGDADVGNAQTLALRPAATSKYLTLSRTSTVDAADLGWFVVQFDQGPGFKVGNFTKSTAGAPATQVISHGLGSVPKAIILWTDGQTNETFSNGSYLLGFGMSDGTISRSVAAASRTAQDESNASTRMAAKALTLVQWSEVLVAEADLQSWDETSFTLRWTTNNATPYVINYLVIGGPDVSAKVVEWTMAGAAGNRSVTGVGFRPNAVLHAHGTHAFTAALPANIAGAGFGLGAMDADGDQWSTAFFTVDNSAPTDTQRGQQTDAALYSFNNGLTVQKKASWVSMDADGFTVNFTTAAAGAARVVSLALKGVNVKPGSFLKTTDAAPATQTIAGVGFRPTAVLLTSAQDLTRAAPVNHSRFGIGASDGVSQGSSAITDQNAVATTSVRAVNKTSKAFIVADTNDSTIGAEANLSTLNSDGFSLSWTTNNAVQTEILYLAVAPLAMTEVRLVSFTASRDPRGVRLAWETGYESDNLGFHIYRDIDGERVRITRTLIAGSGLTTARAGATSGRSYSTWDRDALAQSPAATYFLEDIDVDGRATLHGPFVPQAATAGVGREDGAQESRTVAGLGAHVGWRQERFLTEAPETPTGARASRAAAPGAVLLIPAGGADLAGLRAVKIGVRSAGWVRVPQAALVGAGLPADVDPRRLRLYANGVELPMIVAGEEDGRFDPADAIEFYGTGVDTPDTDTRVYWVVASEAGTARRIGAAPSGSGPDGQPRFWRTVERKDRSLYFAALQNGDAENWFGALVSTAGPVDVPVTVLHPDMSAPGSAMLEAVLQGVTDGVSHRVSISVNGTDVGILEFAGRTRGSVRLPVPHEVLVDGTNYVRLAALGDDDDLTLFDTLRLGYWHTNNADNDSLHFSASGGTVVTIGGFSTGGVRVADITDPESVVELPVVEQPDGYAVSIFVPASGPRTLLAFTPATTFAASYVIANTPSSLRTVTGYDHVVISHPDFLDHAAPLVAHRASQGLESVLVSVEDVYDEFSFGEKSTQALKAFLTHAGTVWRRQPRSVVLVGDATFDPRDYSGMGNGDFVPTRLVDMRGVQLETASDDWFVDRDDDSMPEAAIGRLPVRTPAQAQAVVTGIVNYESSPDGAWAREVTFVSDTDSPEGRFNAANAALEGLLPSGFHAHQLQRDALGSTTLRDLLFDQVAQGRAIVNYLGHGSTRLWGQRGDLLAASDVGQGWRPTGSQLPFVLAMNCLNGYFHGIYDEESLAEALLRRGGAVAVWASSSLTGPEPQAAMNRELFRILFGGEADVLGDALLRTKLAAKDPDVRRSWIFLGDPATRLKGIGRGGAMADVRVPDVVNLTEAAAERALVLAGLGAGTRTAQSSGTVPAGSVTGQMPAAGQIVPRGSLIQLLVSSGPPESTTVERVVVGVGQEGGGRIAVRGGAAEPDDRTRWNDLAWPDINAIGGGVRLAVGDLDGDGLDETVVGLGPGSEGWLAIQDDAANGFRLLGWIQVPWPAYNAANGEVFPAVGDVDGDGRAEIVVGLGPGGAGYYQIVDDALSGFGHLAWRQVPWPEYAAGSGATHPAVADLDGNGTSEIVIGLGSGGDGYLAVVAGASAGFSHQRWIRLNLPGYNAVNGASYPAAGDLDGDGRAELVIGVGHFGGGWLEVLDDAEAGFAHMRWLRLSRDDYNQSNGSETHPAVGNLDGDDAAEIVVGLASSPAGGGWLESFDDAGAGFSSLGWQQIEWSSLPSAASVAFPAVGTMR